MFVTTGGFAQNCTALQHCTRLKDYKDFVLEREGKEQICSGLEINWRKCGWSSFVKGAKYIWKHPFSINSSEWQNQVKICNLFIIPVAVGGGVNIQTPLPALLSIQPTCYTMIVLFTDTRLNYFSSVLEISYVKKYSSLVIYSSNKSDSWNLHRK